MSPARWIILILFLIGVALGLALYHQSTAVPVWAPPMGELTSAYEKIEARNAQLGVNFTYYLLKPPHYDERQSYPLVLLLHGSSRHMAGGRYYLERGIQTKHPAFIVVPIAPAGMDWGRIDSRDIRSATPLAYQAVTEIMSRYNVDKARISVSGYSMGGIGTFAMIEQYPQLFSAGLALCGQWEPERASLFPPAVPILAITGGREPRLFAKPMIKALQQLGRPVEYREYPQAGHNVWDPVYSDEKIWDWLFAQRRAQ